MTALDATKLRSLLDANAGVDWRAVALTNSEIHVALVLCGLRSRETLPMLKAYQRVLRILPPTEDHRALPLLESGLHSAVQIANLSPLEFARRWEALFPGEDELGASVYRAAVVRRGELLLQHIHDVQRNEPHYRAARFK